MALTDTLSGKIDFKLNAWLNRTQDVSITGKDSLNHTKAQSITDGSSTNQASGWFSSTFTATTGGVTISLADFADPLGAAGDDIPSADPEGLKLKAILIQNDDATNFVAVKQGTNGETSIITGSTDSIKISAGGAFMWSSPAGISAMNDGVDDELLFTADTASCSVKISYLFG